MQQPSTEGSSFISTRKQKLLSFRLSPKDFTRNRAITLEHTVGLVMPMSLDRNENGYDISSQKYFRSPRDELSLEIQPVRHQSVSEARGKLGWRAFEYFLGESNLEYIVGLPRQE